MGLPYKIATLIYAFDASGRVLLMRRSREPNQGMWSPFGGKLDITLGESPHECAARETLEEVGISAMPGDFHLTGVVSEKGYLGAAHWLMFLFELKIVVSDCPAPHGEGEFSFFSRSEIDTLEVPETDRDYLWPMFWRHRDGFFAAHCQTDPVRGYCCELMESSNQSLR